MASKAYELRHLDGDDEPCVIVYAANSREAHKRFGEIDNATFMKTQVLRKPEFDAYAPNGPSVTDLIAKHDWWFSCRACHERVTLDECPQFIVRGESRHAPVVYCNAACEEKKAK